VPLVEGVDSPPGATQAFELFKDKPFSFFLDSGMDPRRLGRYSFIGSDPFLVMRSRGRDISLLGADGERRIAGDPFEVLGGLLNRYRLDTGATSLPFSGGAVGYLSYELGHFVERLPSSAADDLQLPECYLAFYDSVVAFDHLEGRAYVAANGFPETDSGGQVRAQVRLDELRRVLAEAPPPVGCDEPLAREADGPIGLHSNFTHEGYVDAVQRVRDYIVAGDIFQANISQRFEADMPLAPYDLYRRLREINPAPFAAFLNMDGVAVVSASPERFLRVRGDRVETRPIKGTRPRGRDEAEDEAKARELLASAKDSAEHVMIVDLERNDLGRVCRYGTVRVSELAALEKYATVFAMEIIDEIEPTRRSVYTGAIGYLGFDGDLDLNIAIRTILVKERRAYFQVGGGVVFDSDPEGEYVETLDKAKALIRALSMVPELVTEGAR
jgi:para-aminobenzoate synthetase component 1